MAPTEGRIAKPGRRWDCRGTPFHLGRVCHRVSTIRRKWYPPAGANAYGWHTPWLAD